MASTEIEQLKKEFKELEEKLASPEVVSDPKKLEELGKRHSELSEIIDMQKQIEELNKNIDENEKLAESDDDESMRELAEEELEKLRPKKEKLEQELEEKLHPEPGAHINETIVEIRAGVGGEEAALFAQELFRMYTRFAELKGWKVGVIEEKKSELKGVKEVVFEVHGKGAYVTLKNESGVHRVQRVPETEKSGRLHTSSASVAVLPKAKPVDIDIKPEDIKIETFRSSGPGGQNVNKVETAVRVIHEPSGIAVASQVHKSQAQNREAAMTLLRSRLLQKKQEEQEKKMRKARKGQIGSGDRSEKIRTYNFPQDRVTDHRINKSWHGIDKIMDGYLDDVVAEIKKEL
ncbi:MAG: peptide chain release factor 1 [Candidatus Spechtbacterales bacterium]|nr:peptide chain release factor 1 [Candidatus Spechtbacterales bacterium]